MSEYRPTEYCRLLRGVAGLLWLGVQVSGSLGTEVPQWGPGAERNFVALD